MLSLFDKPYDPKSVEDKIYKKWEESGYFNPDNLSVSKNQKALPVGRRIKPKSFCIVLPPPNVTGSLHMGHALNAVIQDILIRKKRMEGYKTLWIPGTDHAGIATQNVVEKQLKKEGISRHELGKEKFLEKVWEWKEKYGDIILNQLKKIGVSCDWSRTAFTMDENYSKAVQTAFKHYYEKGWIYQGERIVNWCPRCGTSLSDLELEYEEEKGKLWYIRYPLKIQNSKFKVQNYIVVATTRPETMLGDSAVAVNPKDKRYKDFVGKIVILPIQNREIPIVADEAVEKEFGTGAVKVTPAHDFIDAEIGERHKLAAHKIIGERGKMAEEAGEICAGLKVLECREKVIEKLRELDLLEKEENYVHSVAKCYRCGGTVEPLPSLQWFLKMGDLAKLAIKAVKSGKVKFHPQRWEKVYFDWLNKVKDWCISRQIWWGHQIPLEKCYRCNEFISEPEIKSRWFIVRHGETDWNKEHRMMGHAEVPLNEEGRNQIREIVKQLKNKKINLIISSDLIRCKETAEIISKELGVNIIFDKNLRERNIGEAQGVLFDEREEKFGKEIVESWRKYDGGSAPKEGETLKELEKRIIKSFEDHKINYGGKNVIIITHGGPVVMVNKHIRNISFDESKYIKIKNASILELLISEEKCKKCGGDILEPINDVLDTWFSSALWPFATLGWPEKTKDLKEFYPTTVLSTARDIINLWVARMVYSGVEFTGKEPFSDVIIHATILTKDGKRMSKSLGTGIDPMDLIEKYGADATRFGLIWQAMGGQDIRWAEEHVMAGKKFANKLWNISRFVLGQTAISNFQFPISKEFPNSKLSKEDKEILKKLEQTKKSVSKDIDEYNFGQALHTLYDFIWHDFADIYIEYSKDKDNKGIKQVLYHTLVQILKTLHPFMPFVTEEIYQNLFSKEAEFLMIDKI